MRAGDPGRRSSTLCGPSSKVGATSRATLRACCVTVALAVGVGGSATPATGGRMVRDRFAAAWWTLADAAGNEADIATTMNRD